MALTINTNISSLVAQRNLAKATTGLNQAIERMTTGYKINHAKDNAAGYSIAKNWETQLGSLDVAADNAATGADMLTTLEDTYALVTSHLQRVRDLTEQAANGTYGQDSLDAIKAEITSRLDEIDRISANCEFNGKHLMDASITADINLQIGINADANSQISLDKSLFAKISGENASPYILTVSVRGVRGETLLHELDDSGLIIGTGSACSSNEKKRFSRTILACGLGEDVAGGVLRLSFCPENTIQEICAAAEILNRTAANRKAIMQ